MVEKFVVEIFAPLSKGFMTSAGLIIAIGAQNAFVLTQGLTRRFNVLIASLCAMADAMLITIGVLGMGLLISNNPVLMLLAALGGAVFLSIYSLRSFRHAWSGEALSMQQRSLPNTRAAVIATLAITFLNPHVYLDTVVLVGAIGGQYPQLEQLWFIVGAVLASVVWFFSLSLAARGLAPLFVSYKAWRVLDCLVGGVMALIAIGLWWRVFFVL